MPLQNHIENQKLFSQFNVFAAFNRRAGQIGKMDVLLSWYSTFAMRNVVTSGAKHRLSKLRERGGRWVSNNTQIHISIIAIFKFEPKRRNHTLSCIHRVDIVPVQFFCVDGWHTSWLLKWGRRWANHTTLPFRSYIRDRMCFVLVRYIYWKLYSVYLQKVGKSWS